MTRYPAASSLRRPVRREMHRRGGIWDSTAAAYYNNLERADDPWIPRSNLHRSRNGPPNHTVSTPSTPSSHSQGSQNGPTNSTIPMPSLTMIERNALRAQASEKVQRARDNITAGYHQAINGDAIQTPSRAIIYDNCRTADAAENEMHFHHDRTLASARPISTELHETDTRYTLRVAAGECERNFNTRTYVYANTVYAKHLKASKIIAGTIYSGNMTCGELNTTLMHHLPNGTQPEVHAQRHAAKPSPLPLHTNVESSEHYGTMHDDLDAMIVCAEVVFADKVECDKVHTRATFDLGKVHFNDKGFLQTNPWGAHYPETDSGRNNEAESSKAALNHSQAEFNKSCLPKTGETPIASRYAQCDSKSNKRNCKDPNEIKNLYERHSFISFSEPFSDILDLDSAYGSDRGVSPGSEEFCSKQTDEPKKPELHVRWATPLVQSVKGDLDMYWLDPKTRHLHPVLRRAVHNIRRSSNWSLKPDRIIDDVRDSLELTDAELTMNSARIKNWREIADSKFNPRYDPLSEKPLAPDEHRHKEEEAYREKRRGLLGKAVIAGDKLKQLFMS